MARNTKPLSGGAKDKFLRGLIATVEGVPVDVVRAVTQQLTESIAEVRARLEVYERIRDSEPTAPSPENPRHQALPQIARKAAEPAAAAVFDPFAFSAVAVLTKKGRAALSAELDNIASGEHLRRLAEAQHLSLDPALADIADMRTAIILGTERRIAERKAAAS